MELARALAKSRQAIRSLENTMILKIGFAVLLCSLSPSARSGDVFAEAVQLKADGEVLDISKDLSYSGPWIVDRDGDGKRDLIVTSIKGKFRWYKNVGTDVKPSYEHKGLVKVGEVELELHNW